MKAFYEIGYKYFKMPWDIGPRTELVELVTNGRIKPGRAIDLGSGTASNCIFLAERGFTVTGVDYAQSAVDKGRRMAAKAGVSAEFIHDDLTNLQHVTRTFDFLVDYGTLDDLKPADRDKYMDNILPLTKPGSQFLIFVFEWPLRWWEKVLNLVAGSMRPGEVQARFGDLFEIEEISRHHYERSWMQETATYLMTRK